MTLKKIIENRATLLRLGLRTIGQETAFLCVVHSRGIATKNIAPILDMSVSNTGELMRKLESLGLVSNAGNSTWEPTSLAIKITGNIMKK